VFSIADESHSISNSEVSLRIESPLLMFTD
jgi:hypothetical protein